MNQVLLQTQPYTEILKDYLFPVEVRQVGYEDMPTEIFQKANLAPTNKYQAIVRADNTKLISIMPMSYKLVPNKEVILPILEFLDKCDNKWYIDQSHSFVDSNRMRLQITFPELTVNDGDSDVALSLFLHNSYNGVEGVRCIWGGIRAICTNGMVFGKLLGSFYHRHTSGINLMDLQSEMTTTISRIPIIEERIQILKNIEATSKQIYEVEQHLGKKTAECVEREFTIGESQYVLLNVLTFYISHLVKVHLRASYQKKLSNIFGL